MLHGNVINMKEACHNRSIALACNESEATNPLCVISRQFRIFLSPISSHQTLPPVLPHLRLVQLCPHHPTQIASVCTLCFACAVFFDLLTQQQHCKGLIADGAQTCWGFSARSSLAWPNSSTAKAPSLMVHVLVGAQSQLLPWRCLEPICWKLSRGFKLGKWNYDCIINHKMELTQSCPLQGSVAIFAKTVVKMVDGLRSNILLGWSGSEISVSGNVQLKFDKSIACHC